MPLLLRITALCLLATCLSACSTIENASDSVAGWFSSDSPRTISSNNDDSAVRDDGRIDIMIEDSRLDIEEGALSGAQLKPAQPVQYWLQDNGSASGTLTNIKGAALTETLERATIGDGNDWVAGAQAPSALISDRLVIAMDGYGIISAHSKDDIDDVVWDYDRMESEEPLLVGGLALQGKVLFAVTGQGKLDAINTDTGRRLWSTDIGQPVRSSVRYYNKSLLLITADNRLQRYAAANGRLQWEHRGIAPDTVMFGATVPALYDNRLFVAYGSGELFMLRSNDGSTMWTDRLQRPRRTIATGMFSGVDANTLLTPDLAIAAATSGLTIADSPSNGRRLWSLPVGTNHSPWLNGDALFMVTEDGALAGIHSFNGTVGWLTPLPYDQDETMPHFFGPIMLNNTVVVLGSDGWLAQYNPFTGNIIRSVDFIEGITASPSFSEKRAYIVTSDATLHEVQ